VDSHRSAGGIETAREREEGGTAMKEMRGSPRGKERSEGRRSRKRKGRGHKEEQYERRSMGQGETQKGGGL